MVDTYRTDNHATTGECPCQEGYYEIVNELICPQCHSSW